METAFIRFDHYPENIPDELKKGDVWVTCDEHKVPLIPITTGACFAAASTKPETWRTYRVALGTYLNNEHVAGVGRVIREYEDYAGVDLDGCVDLDGQLAPWANEIVNRLGSYAEISPSMTGIKIWVKAPELTTSYQKPGLEIYAGRRYFTTTGLVLSFTEIVDAGEELLKIVEEEFPRVDRRFSYDGPKRLLNLEEFLERTQVEVFTLVDDSTAVRKFAVQCPWYLEHTHQDDSGTYVGQFESGGLFFHCHHAHCSGRGWREFKDRMLMGRPSRCRGRGGRLQ